MRTLYLILFLFITTHSFSQQKTTHTVYFDFDATQPGETVRKELASFLDRVKQLQVTHISIEGHTDIKGSSAYNNKLSEARAEAVNGILASWFPPGSPVTVSSYGKDKLLTPDDEKQEINRRVEIVVYYMEKQKPVTEIEPFFEDVELQHFSINLDDTVLIIGKEGTILKIAPGSVQDKKGRKAKGQALLLLKEYYRPGDIMLSGLNSNSENGPLETGGMFNMVIIKDGDTMSSQSLKPVTIKMPVVNNATGKMNIYVIDHKKDSSVWTNTNSFFNRLFSYWEWPKPTGRLTDLVIPDIKFENWRVGHQYTDEYISHAKGSWYLFNTPMGNRSDARVVTNEIRKVDSFTIRASLKMRYRNKGVRKYGTKYFDTTFLVKYQRAEYEGISSNISWINCDRFLNNTNPTDFYVSTPDFKGAGVMVYFKNQNAFLPAYESGNGLYKVTRVPPNQKAWIVAFGKKNGEYYYSKKEFIVANNATTDLSLAKISQEDFRKEMSSF